MAASLLPAPTSCRNFRLRLTTYSGMVKILKDPLLRNKILRSMRKGTSAAKILLFVGFFNAASVSNLL